MTMLMIFLYIKYQHISLRRETRITTTANVYADNGPNPLYKSIRPRSLAPPLIPSHPSLPSPRMIRPIHPQLRPSVPSPSTHASRAKLLSIYQYWCHLKHYNLESTNYKVPNTDPTPCLYPSPIPGKSQYCCMVCFDWCIRQNAPSSQIPLPDVYLY